MLRPGCSGMGPGSSLRYVRDNALVLLPPVNRGGNRRLTPYRHPRHTRFSEHKEAGDRRVSRGPPIKSEEDALIDRRFFPSFRGRPLALAEARNRKRLIYRRPNSEIKPGCNNSNFSR